MSLVAGASLTIPMEAGQIRKGGYIVIQNRPCKVENVSTSKTGKHGHAKCNFVAKDIFTGKRYEDIVPSTHSTTVPNVFRSEYMVLDIELGDDASEANPSGARLSCLDEASGEENNTLSLPDFPDSLASDIYNTFKETQEETGDKAGHTLFVQCLKAMDHEQVVGFRSES